MLRSTWPEFKGPPPTPVYLPGKWNLQSSFSGVLSWYGFKKRKQYPSVVRRKSCHGQWLRQGPLVRAADRMPVQWGVYCAFSPLLQFLSFVLQLFACHCSVGCLPEPCELLPPAPCQHQQMVRSSSHADIEDFQVKFRDVQRRKKKKRHFFLWRSINSSRFLEFFPFNGLSKSIDNVYIMSRSMFLKSVCNFHDFNCRLIG